MTLLNNRCLVIGAGEMGRAHIAALAALGVGRISALAASERNRAAVEAMGAEFFCNGVAAAVADFAPTHAVIATPVDTLASLTVELIGLGVRDILVEKPAALDRREADLLRNTASDAGARVHVGYNRRFYGSVRKASAMIQASGESVTGVSFEFTEWSDVIRALTNQSERAKARWLLANSLHVIDLAFLPAGLPDATSSRFLASGALDWHPTSTFVGAGMTTAQVPFSYFANWDAPGRWGVEWLTPSTRYIFRPMEKLHIVKRGTVAIVEVPLDDDLDQRFKPGLYRQNRAFLTGEDADGLATLAHALALLDLGIHMGGYQA